MVLGQTPLHVKQDLGCRRLSHSSAAGALVSPYPSAEVVQQGEVHCVITVATFQVAVTHRSQVDHDRGMTEREFCMHVCSSTAGSTLRLAKVGYSIRHKKLYSVAPQHDTCVS